ncbi:MAG: helix-turn-helix domain-containing protein [Rhodospirillaceae bacterium]|nr:helix-turn-helix domain-containing protein [Rhodospirillaceae bacterium]
MTMSKAVSVKSAQRVFEVLEAFRRRQEPMTAKAVAETLGYPLSSTSILLRAMAGLGYLAVDLLDRSYFPTKRVAELGGWILDSRVVDPALIALAKTVHAKLGDSITLSVPVGQEIEFIFVRLAKHPIGLSIQVGARLPLCQSISGLGWLMTCPAGEARRIIDHHNQVSGRTHHVVPSQLLAQIKRARERGFAAGPAPMFPGFATVSVPLIDTVHDRVVVLSASGVKTGMLAREEYVGAVMLDVCRPALATRVATAA